MISTSVNSGVSRPTVIAYIPIARASGFTIYIIKHSIKQLAAEIYTRSVRKMSTVIKTHSKNRVARFQYAKVSGHVSLRTRMRLYINMIISVERLTPLVAAILFQLVNILTAAIVTPLVS